VSLGFHVSIANLLFWFSTELKLQSFHVEWGIYDAVRAEQEKETERARFLRPETRTSPLGLDDRFRRAQR
jgi:hypothetical protein